MTLSENRAGGPGRRLVLAGLGAAAGLGPSLAFAQAGSGEALAEIDSGRIRGRRIAGVDVYKGVPYGDSVSGADRFKPARAVKPWAGVRDALQLGPPTLQDRSTVFGGPEEPDPAEDCLVLNVWAPSAPGRGRPVMVYAHGGGFTTGSGGSPDEDGANLAREHDVVVITHNHRLGLLGYLYLEELGGAEYAGSGNQGMSDLVLVHDWVRRNAHVFGGDPDNVMIFGESGGGAKVACLYSMPAMRPLFAKAVIQSGPALRLGSREAAAQTTDMFLKELGIARSDWRRLLGVPAADLLKAQQALEGRNRREGGAGWRGIAEFQPGGYGPMLDGKLFPRHPFDPDAPPVARDKPLMVGWMDEEAAFFAWAAKNPAMFQMDETALNQQLKAQLGDDAGAVLAAYRASRPGATPSQLFIAIASAHLMGVGSTLTAERKAAQGGAPVYYYNVAYHSNLTVPGTNYEVGAMHAVDIGLVFNDASAATALAGSRPERLVAARNMSRFWTSFARTGRPVAEGQPGWPAYDLKSRSAMVLDAQCKVVPDRFAKERKVWERLRLQGSSAA